MNTAVLRLIMKSHHINQSKLASLCGVTRQAVSLWFKELAGGGREIHLKTKYLLRLSQAFSVRLEDLLAPLPLLEERSIARILETTFIWDRLYDSLEDFLIATIRREPPAVARFVQVLGLFQGAKILGRFVWSDFQRYKNHLQPVRKKECEMIWKLQQDLGLI